MLNVLFIIFISIFSLYGLIELLRVIKLYILTEKSQSFMIVIPACGHNEKIELVIRTAIEQVRWLYKGRDCDVIIADMGMDEETRDLVFKICNDFDFVYYCEFDEINTFIRECSGI
jgi:hypothetical protein